MERIEIAGIVPRCVRGNPVALDKHNLHPGACQSIGSRTADNAAAHNRNAPLVGGTVRVLRNRPDFVQKYLPAAMFSSRHSLDRLAHPFNSTVSP